MQSSRDLRRVGVSTAIIAVIAIVVVAAGVGGYEVLGSATHGGISQNSSSQSNNTRPSSTSITLSSASTTSSASSSLLSQSSSTSSSSSSSIRSTFSSSTTQVSSSVSSFQPVYKLKSIQSFFGNFTALELRLGYGYGNSAQLTTATYQSLGLSTVNGSRYLKLNVTYSLTGSSPTSQLFFVNQTGYVTITTYQGVTSAGLNLVGEDFLGPIFFMMNCNSEACGVNMTMFTTGGPSVTFLAVAMEQAFIDNASGFSQYSFANASSTSFGSVPAATNWYAANNLNLGVFSPQAAQSYASYTFTSTIGISNLQASKGSLITYLSVLQYNKNGTLYSGTDPLDFSFQVVSLNSA